MIVVHTVHRASAPCISCIVYVLCIVYAYEMVCGVRVRVTVRGGVLRSSRFFATMVVSSLAKNGRNPSAGERW